MQQKSRIIATLIGLSVVTGCTLEGLPNCREGSFRCDQTDGSSTCILQICENDAWTNRDTCKYGWNQKDGCKIQCSGNETTTITEEKDGEKLYFIARCVNSEFKPDPMPCMFGISNNQCIDPCDICTNKDSGVSVKCNQLYSEKTKTIYHCDNSGWQTDYSCNNDFIIKNEISVNIDSFNQTSSSSEQELHAGTCGNCNHDTQPDYYTTFTEGGTIKKVHHHCVNGEWKVEELSEDIPDNYERCTETYNDEVYVDKSSNRYHCGSCENACGAGQYCENSTCESRIICNEDNYASIQVGGRTIRAFCLKSEEDLLKIADTNNNGKIFENNYDNAYVLDNNITIKEPWKPIGTNAAPFKGILFGNGKTITLDNGIDMSDNPDHAGLFGYITDSHIEHLTIVYNKSQNYEIENTKFIYGGLTGHLDNSTLNDISLTMPNTVIDLQKVKDKVINDMGKRDTTQDICIGGLIGYANESTLSNLNITTEIHALNAPRSHVGGVLGSADRLVMSDVVLAVTVEGQNDWYVKSRLTTVGGLVGHLEDVISIKRISINKAHPLLDVKGNSYTGGLIGTITQRTIAGEISNHIENGNIPLDNVSITGTLKIIGGLIGYILISKSESTEPIPQIIIDGFDLNNLNIKMEPDNLLAAKALYDADYEMDDNDTFPRYIGGIISLVSMTQNRNQIIVKNIHLNNYTFDSSSMVCYDNPSNKVKYSSHAGGFGGLIRLSTISDVAIKGYKHIDTSDCTHFVRGVAGMMASEDHNTFNNIQLSGIDIALNNNAENASIGGMMGYSNASDITSCSVNNLNLSINHGSNIGGIFGKVISTSINQCNIKNIMVKQEHGENIGLIAGNASKVQIQNTTVTGNDNKKNILSGDTRIGGFVGYCTACQITGCTGSETNTDDTSEDSDDNDNQTKQKDQCLNLKNIEINASGGGVGGLVGTATYTGSNRPKISHVVLDHVNINNIYTDPEDTTPPQSTGGLVGAAYNLDLDNVKLLNTTINNENANPTYGTGVLFGATLNDNNIKNVYMQNNIVQGNTHTGIIVGKVRGSSSTYQNILIVDQTIKGNNTIGGLFGNIYNKAKIQVENTSAFINLEPLANNLETGGILGSIEAGSSFSIFNSSIVAQIHDTQDFSDKYGELIGNAQNNPQITAANVYTKIRKGNEQIPLFGGLSCLNPTNSNIHHYFQLDADDMIPTICEPCKSEATCQTNLSESTSFKNGFNAELLNDPACICSVGKAEEIQEQFLCLKPAELNSCSNLKTQNASDFCGNTTENDISCTDVAIWKDYPISDFSQNDTINELLCGDSADCKVPLPFEKAPWKMEK